MKPPTFSVSARADDFANRRCLALGLIPVLVPLALCLLSLTQRLLREPGPGAHLSPVQASVTAGELCEQIIEGDAQAGKATFSRGFSINRRKSVRQWDVVCDTPQGQYLFRINADNHQVFGINLLETENAPSAAQSRLSRAEAEVYSRRYLNLLGINPDELRLANVLHGEAKSQWHFRYRMPLPGQKSGLLIVSMEDGTGNLVSAWSPAAVL